MNCKAYQEKEHLYKRRQAIVEHPYGTLKRQWGFNYILTKKGIEHASADVGFMFIAYMTTFFRLSVWDIIFPYSLVTA